MRLLVGKMESPGEVGSCRLIRRCQRDNPESAEGQRESGISQALTAKVPTLTLSAGGSAAVLRERVREGRWS